MAGNNLHLAAIHRIVVFVGLWSDLTIRREHPSPRLRDLFKSVLFLLIQEWCSWPLLIYGEFRVGHEVVDGVLVLGFLNAFVEGTMECFDHFDRSDSGLKNGIKRMVFKCHHCESLGTSGASPQPSCSLIK